MEAEQTKLMTGKLTVRDRQFIEIGKQLGADHCNPSPETIKMFQEQNKVNKKISEDIEQIKLALFGDKELGISGIVECNREVQQALLGIHEKLDRKYASKWVEHAAKGLIVMCVLAVVYLIFDHVGIPRASIR